MFVTQTILVINKERNQQGSRQWGSKPRTLHVTLLVHRNGACLQSMINSMHGRLGVQWKKDYSMK